MPFCREGDEGSSLLPEQPTGSHAAAPLSLGRVQGSHPPGPGGLTVRSLCPVATPPQASRAGGPGASPWEQGPLGAVVVGQAGGAPTGLSGGMCDSRGSRSPPASRVQCAACLSPAVPRAKDPTRLQRTLVSGSVPCPPGCRASAPAVPARLPALGLTTELLHEAHVPAGVEGQRVGRDAQRLEDGCVGNAPHGQAALQAHSPGLLLAEAAVPQGEDVSQGHVLLPRQASVSQRLLGGAPRSGGLAAALHFRGQESVSGRTCPPRSSLMVGQSRGVAQAGLALLGLSL